MSHFFAALLADLLPGPVTSLEARRIADYTQNSISHLPLSYAFAIYVYLLAVSPFIFILRLTLSSQRFRTHILHFPFPAWGLMVRLLKTLALMAYFDEVENGLAKNKL